jgi:hypothetical protein
MSSRTSLSREPAPEWHRHPPGSVSTTRPPTVAYDASTLAGYAGVPAIEPLPSSSGVPASPVTSAEGQAGRPSPTPPLPHPSGPVDGDFIGKAGVAVNRATWLARQVQELLDVPWVKDAAKFVVSLFIWAVWLSVCVVCASFWDSNVVRVIFGESMPPTLGALADNAVFRVAFMSLLIGPMSPLFRLVRSVARLVPRAKATQRDDLSHRP